MLINVVWERLFGFFMTLKQSDVKKLSGEIVKRKIVFWTKWLIVKEPFPFLIV